MGMSDDEVEAGKFDKRGMMDMGAMHDMESMNHGQVPSKMKMERMDHTSGEGAGSKSHEDTLPMEHTTSTTGGMNHNGHSMVTLPQASRIGKKYGADFRRHADPLSLYGQPGALKRT